MAFNIGKVLDNLINVIVGILVVLALMSQALPSAQTEGDTLNSSTTLPLRGLFAGSGVLFLIIMASVLLGIIRIAQGVFSKGK